MVKVADREQTEPAATVSLSTVDEHEGGGQLALVLGWDVVHHLGSVTDGVEREPAWHLLLCEVGAGHVHDRLPVALD